MARFLFANVRFRRRRLPAYLPVWNGISDRFRPEYAGSVTSDGITGQTGVSRILLIRRRPYDADRSIRTKRAKLIEARGAAPFVNRPDTRQQSCPCHAQHNAFRYGRRSHADQRGVIRHQKLDAVAVKLWIQAPFRRRRRAEGQRRASPRRCRSPGTHRRRQARSPAPTGSGLPHRSPALRLPSRWHRNRG